MPPSLSFLKKLSILAFLKKIIQFLILAQFFKYYSAEQNTFAGSPLSLPLVTSLTIELLSPPHASFCSVKPCLSLYEPIRLKIFLSQAPGSQEFMSKNMGPAHPLPSDPDHRPYILSYGVLIAKERDERTWLVGLWRWLQKKQICGAGYKASPSGCLWNDHRARRCCTDLGGGEQEGGG